MHTTESKRKIGDAHRGKIISNETKKKISDSKKGIIPWNKGKKCKKASEETKLKMSLSHKGKTHNIESKQKMSIQKLGNNNPNFGKKLSNKTKQKIAEKLINRKLSKIHILKLKRTINKIKTKYPIFSKIEKMRYNPDKPDEKEIQVHCKNHNCPNSKEQVGWFTPTGRQIELRIVEVEKGNGGSYFYCCDECKRECPLFGLNPTHIINQNNLPSDIQYTQEEYQTFRNEVLKRSNNKCEYCGNDANIVHHSQPQKLEPFFSLDPDFGVACCETCHYKYGHKDECSTRKLANKVCS